MPACLKTLPKPRDQSHFAPTEKRSADLGLALREQQEREDKKKPRRHVMIEGDDILLPEATPDQIAGEHSYYFDIAVDDPDGRPAVDLVRDGTLRVQTIGAEATLMLPEAPKKKEQNGSLLDLPETPALTINSGKVRLKVTTNNDGVLRPFTILAWYPGRSDGAENEYWSDRRYVRVYYGDIRTRVQIISRTEAQSLFGNTFAEHFYVGRVFLRNRSTSKSLAVYTTSMRVPVFFYRKSELPGGLTPAAAERLGELARVKWPVVRQEEAGQKQSVGGKPPVPARLDRLGAAESLVHDFLHSAGPAGRKESRDPFVNTAPNARSPSDSPWVSKEEKDALVARVLAEWARLEAIDVGHQNDEKKLTEAERRSLISVGLAGVIPAPEKRSGEAAARAKKQLGDEREKQAGPIARELLLRIWEGRKQLQDSALANATDAENRAAEIYGGVEAHGKKLKNPKQRDLYSSIQAELSRVNDLGRVQNATEYAALRLWLDSLPAVRSRIEQLTELEDRTPLSAAAEELPMLVLRAADNFTLLRYLRNLDDTEQAKLAYPSEFVRHQIEGLKNRASSGGARGLFDDGTGSAIRVNPGDHSLALSEDPHRQRELLESGYVWRDAYRPMTFQSVLSAVMFAHKKDPKTRFIEVLETIATIGGGAVGLSGDVGSSSLKAANFFSSILVPSLRTAMVEDLNKHITNLGDMAMDTVVIIPPNDSVDRFVFFPRDAIYNFPDEFDPVSPAYIVGVEGNELFVEAVPINSDQVVRGGAVDASTLVTRALNEGERSESARLLQIAQTQSRLRTAELGNLTARIKTLFDAAKKAPEGPERDQAMRLAQEEARRLTAAFTAYFGPDQSGALSAALAEGGISQYNAPPAVAAAQPLKIPQGLKSMPSDIFVTDADTPAEDLKIVRKDKDNPEAWLSEVTINKTGSRFPRAVFAINKELPPGVRPPVRKELTLLISDPGGNTASYVQPIEIMPLAFETPVVKIDDNDVSVTGPGDAQSVVIKQRSGRVVVEVPYYDGDVSQLKLAIVDPLQSDLSFISGSRFTNDVERKRLRLTVDFDASTATAGDTDQLLKVYLVPLSTPNRDRGLADAAIKSTTLTLKLK